MIRAGLILISGALLSFPAYAESSKGHGAKGPLQVLMQNFDAIDVNADGKITPDEFDAHHKDRMASADKNQDGLLSEEEIAEFHLQRSQERADDMAKRMIDRLDVDKDGSLSQAELDGLERRNMPLERLDTDQDGAISKDEIDAASEKREKRRRD